MLRRLSTMSSQAKVFVTRNIPQEALELLKQRYTVSGWWSDAAVPREELEKGVADADALYCLLTDSVDKDLLDKAPKLKVISTMSVGSDHIDLEACKARKLKVGYTPDVLTEATAELTLALLLATSRRLFEASANVRKSGGGGWLSGGWGTWSPLWMCGSGLEGSVVGVVGLGRIGASVAEKLKAFKPEKLLYHTPKPKPDLASALGAEFASLDELAAAADFVVVCCPLNDATRGLFGEDFFAKMKPTAVFVNTSRGPVVDQDALVEALKTGRIGAAGLDVTTPEPLPTDHPLLSLPNCLVLPHIGSATVRTRTAMAMLAARNLIAGLNDQKMPAALLSGQILV